MKKIGLVLVVMLGQMIMLGQNLVPNPSFELIDSCDIYSGGVWWGQCPPWNNPTYGSDDLYNFCSTSGSSYSVPNNMFGFQYPHLGNGYIGGQFIGAGGGDSSCGYRAIEYAQIKLDTPLAFQEHYCVSFYVSLADRFPYIAMKNIGMYLSDTIVNYPTQYCELNFTPQVKDTNFISDTAHWTLIYGQYVAHGGEQYIILGSFGPNIYSDTIQLVPGGNVAYYYIDDVNIHCCTCDSTTSLHAGVAEIKEGEIKIMPNPTSTIFTITSTDKIESVKLYSILGELLITERINNNQAAININQFSKGIYFAEIKTEKGIVRKKVVKE